MPAYDYTTTMYFTRTSTRTGGSQASFTRVTGTGGFVSYRPGTPSTRESTYARSYMTAQGELASTEYSRTFVGDFIGNFTSYYTRSFSRTRTEEYTGYYSRNFVGYYSRDYTGYYSREFTGLYSRSFTRSYARNFSRHFARAYTGYYSRTSTQSFTRTSVESYSRDFTRISTYTRTLSGGSGEAPTYTVSGSDAEYGLVVYGPDGTTEIINPTTRVINLAFYGTVPVAANSTATVTIQDVGDPSKVTASLLVHYTDIELSASGNTLTVINNRSTASSPQIIAIRI